VVRNGAVLAAAVATLTAPHPGALAAVREPAPPGEPAAASDRDVPTPPDGLTRAKVAVTVVPTAAVSAAMVTAAARARAVKAGRFVRG
jgi:hypothetical protein